MSTTAMHNGLNGKIHGEYGWYDARVSFDIHGTCFQRCDGKNFFKLSGCRIQIQDNESFFFSFLFVNTPIFPLLAGIYDELLLFWCSSRGKLINFTEMQQKLYANCLIGAPFAHYMYFVSLLFANTLLIYIQNLVATSYRTATLHSFSL